MTPFEQRVAQLRRQVSRPDPDLSKTPAELAAGMHESFADILSAIRSANRDWDLLDRIDLALES